MSMWQEKESDDESSHSTGKISMMLAALNILLFVFHTVILVFNLTGWIFPRTQTLHIVCLGATLFSWFVMGAWKGIGYCICTECFEKRK